jgi:hypothetical protein
MIFKDWSPALNSIEPYLEIHFGNLTEVGMIDIILASDSTGISEYKIMTSIDGIDFTDLDTVSLSTDNKSCVQDLSNFERLKKIFYV